MIGVQSLTLRLTLYFALASTAVLLGTGSLIGARVQAHLVSQDLAEMNGKLELVRHMLARVRTDDELAGAGAHLADALVGHEHLALVVLAGPQQELFRTPHAVFPEALVRWPPPTSTSGPLQWEQGTRSYRGIVGPVRTAVEGRRTLAVALSIDIGHHLEFMDAFHVSLLVALVAGVGLSALLGWVAARRGLTPLQELTAALRGISAGRLDERLPLAAMPAELVDLADAFNQVLARLQDSFTRLSHFSSDIAHELRTPISNLMLQTQVAASKARSAEAYREVLYSNLEEFEHLARMIGDMLFLAQAENGLVVPHGQPIDLAAESQALLSFYEALADEQGVRLTIEGDGSVDGDRLMIRRALSNLLANAIAHTPRGGTVRVVLQRRDDGGTTLQVSNPGAIAAEHLPRLFDRFYRVDPARPAAASGPGGAGLGLAITQSIVAAHGATIRVASSDGSVCFTIDWPAAAPPDAAEGQDR